MRKGVDGSIRDRPASCCFDICVRIGIDVICRWNGLPNHIHKAILDLVSVMWWLVVNGGGGGLLRSVGAGKVWLPRVGLFGQRPRPSHQPTKYICTLHSRPPLLCHLSQGKQTSRTHVWPGHLKAGGLHKAAGLAVNFLPSSRRSP